MKSFVSKATRSPDCWSVVTQFATSVWRAFPSMGPCSTVRLTDNQHRLETRESGGWRKTSLSLNFWRNSSTQCQVIQARQALLRRVWLKRDRYGTNGSSCRSRYVAHWSSSQYQGTKSLVIVKMLTGLTKIWMDNQRATCSATNWKKNCIFCTHKHVLLLDLFLRYLFL